MYLVNIKFTVSIFVLFNASFGCLLTILPQWLGNEQTFQSRQGWSTLGKERVSWGQLTRSNGNTLRRTTAMQGVSKSGTPKPHCWNCHHLWYPWYPPILRQSQEPSCVNVSSWFFGHGEDITPSSKMTPANPNQLDHCQLQHLTRQAPNDSKSPAATLSDTSHQPKRKSDYSRNIRHLTKLTKFHFRRHP
jgi:hypothetical protein